MSVATSAEDVLNGATPRPKQTKLLGATVRGLGVIVAVSSTLTYGYAIIEGVDRVNHRVAFKDLKRSEVEFPAEPQPFTTRVEQVSYGVWDEEANVLYLTELLSPLCHACPKVSI